MGVAAQLPIKRIRYAIGDACAQSWWNNAIDAAVAAASDARRH